MGFLIDSMEKQLEALVALHEPMVAQVVCRPLKLKGYKITTANSVVEMLQRMGIEEGKAVPETFPYAVYVMDVNLGFPGADTYAPALQVYCHVQEAAETGALVFMTMTGNTYLVETARQAGLPCISKPDFADYMKMIRKVI